MAGRSAGFTSRLWIAMAWALLGLAQGLTAEEPVLPTAAAPPPAEAPLRVGGDVTRPELISHPAPVYTQAARKARVQGVVILETVIDEQGNVTDVKVLKGLPMGLDQAAVEAVKTWKFEPATREGKPVQVYYVLTVNFQLGESAYQGPGFKRFLAQHPELSQALDAESYDEAADLLAGWAAQKPGDPGIRLARTYLFLEQGSFDDAWQEAQGLAGANRQEVLQAFASYALAQAYYQSPEEARATIEAGLQATEAGLAAQPDSEDLLENKALLLRTKADRATGPDERERWNREAFEVEMRLKTLREGGGGK